MRRKYDDDKGRNAVSAGHRDTGARGVGKSNQGAL